MRTTQLLGAAVDGHALVQVLWSASLAGVGATVVFALAIRGATRALDAARDGHTAQALVVGALGAVAAAGVLALVVLGIVVMAKK